MRLGATLGIENSVLFGDRIRDSTWRETGRWTGAVVCEHAQPARKSQYSLSELPRSKRLEADSLPARVRSQQHQVSVAGHARGLELYAVPHQTSLLECRNPVRGLPRGYPQAADGRKLRTMPQR
jgi:hypothetical protein